MAAGVNVRQDDTFPLISRAAGTFNSQGNAIPESFTNCIIFVNATTVGTSLDLKYQVSPDEGVTWYDHPDGTMVQITAAGTKAFAIRDTIGSFYRLQQLNVGTVVSGATVEFKR